MRQTETLQKELDAIHTRNRRVELDKAWETSWTRKIIITILTYGVIVIFFWTAELPQPWTNALVPTIAFLLSTAGLRLFKQWWIKIR